MLAKVLSTCQGLIKDSSRSGVAEEPVTDVFYCILRLIFRLY